ncbi:MAG: trans-sulfuration enzyme family protein [Actinomycetota bacterium]
MSAERKPGFSTRAVGAWMPEEEVRQQPASPPLYQASTFIFDDVDDFASVAKTKISGGYLYSRWGNPTVDALARVVASLEGAEATACFGSGMGVIAGTLFSLVSNGDHIVAAAQLYGGTHSLFGTALARAGVAVTTADVGDHAAVEAAFTDRTKVLYCETIGNPTMNVADLDALAAIARTHGVAFVVDATFTPPSLLRPLEHGADLVCHSATKYLGGHGDVTGGVVSGDAERIAAIRRLSIDTGGGMAPFDAWLIARGVQTLVVRVDRICQNAMALARALEDHPAVRRVLYPGLESHPDHALARKLLGERFGGMLTFDAGDGAAGRRFLERVHVAGRAASLGGTKTLVVHPASVTHTQLTPEQRARIGLTEGMVRVSVGIEDLDDLIDDFEQALA